MISRKPLTLFIIVLLITLIPVGCKQKSGPEAVWAIEDYDDRLTVYFFHMDYKYKTGESILIKTPKGKTVLIDAGTRRGGLIVNEYLDKLGIDRLDYVMPSHPHIDHIDGFRTIFVTREIGKVIETNVSDDMPVYENYKQLLKEHDLNVEIGEAGDVIELEKDLKLEILYPPKGTSEDSLPENHTELSAKYVNNLSMVVKLTYKENSFLFRVY